MPSYARRLALLVAAALFVACGGSPPPPSRTADIQVGKGAADAGAPAAPIAREPMPEDDAALPIASDDAVRGKRDAYVTIVVFSDFQCPFCSRLVGTLDRVRETYGDDVRLVFKNEPLPFHQHARFAAQMGAGVLALNGADAFWRYHDMAFRRQQLISPEAIRAWATNAGADTRAIEAQADRWEAKVKRDEELAKKVGAVGTPASFINGVYVAGAQPFEKFQSVIDDELAKAKALAERGVPRDTIYRQRAAENLAAAAQERAAHRDGGDRDDDDAPEAPDATVWKVPVAGSPARGPATALVTIVEFGDFQCPFCKRVEPTVEKIRATYGDRVRVVWKDQPLSFHPRALPAANLARSARAQKGDAAFWKVHDELFARGAIEDSDLESVARAAGLDVAKAMAAVKKNQFGSAIDKDTSLGDDVKASGTPHFFINGRRVVGAQPFEKFKSVIDEEITKAEALAKKGVAKTALYDAIIKDGKTADAAERKNVAVPAASEAPFRGAANAKVVIQEFSDFQCPFCKRAEPTLDELLKAYPGKVKIVWRNLPLPFHQHARLAAEAAREVFAQKGNAGFSKMRAMLFEHQADPGGLERPALEGYARKLGVDMTKFGKALDDHKHEAAIKADEEAAKGAGIRGTPGFVVGPFFVSGAQPLHVFKRAVDRALVEPPAPKPGPARTTASGLRIEDLAVGSGPAAKSGDKLVVHYTGTLKDGTVFDSSRTRNQPFEFDLGAGHVIKGWDEGLVGMRAGGRRKLVIPPALAYGDRGAGGKIPPKSTLTFDVELVQIK